MIICLATMNKSHTNISRYTKKLELRIDYKFNNTNNYILPFGITININSFEKNNYNQN